MLWFWAKWHTLWGGGHALCPPLIRMVFSSKSFQGHNWNFLVGLVHDECGRVTKEERLDSKRGLCGRVGRFCTFFQWYAFACCLRFLQQHIYLVQYVEIYTHTQNYLQKRQENYYSPLSTNEPVIVGPDATAVSLTSGPQTWHIPLHMHVSIVTGSVCIANIPIYCETVHPQICCCC